MAAPQRPSVHRLFLAGMQPLTANTTIEPSNSTKGSLDTDMVIVLAALLCALILAVGLNSILRCARAGNFMLALQSHRADSATSTPRTALSELPVIAFGSQAGLSVTDCPICLAEFLDCEKVRILPLCRHGFHVNCIDAWFLAHSTCPLCRQTLLQNAPAP